jgi:uncharacterized protein
MTKEKKSSKTEDEYIAKEEAEKIKRLQDKLKEEAEAKQRAEIQSACFMRCPKCGGELEEIMFQGIKIDRCTSCDGVWLDEGELEKLAGSDDANIIGGILGFFKSES